MTLEKSLLLKIEKAIFCKRIFDCRPADRDPAAEGQADSQPGERPQGQAAGGGWPPREDQEVGDDLSYMISWKK